MIRKQTRRQALDRQVQRLQNRLIQLKRTSQQLSNIRLALFFLGLIVSGLTFVFTSPLIWLITSLLLIVVFVILVRFHRQISTMIRQYEIWQSLKVTHLARMDLAWKGLPPALPLPPRLAHPFATDIDLVGDRSLHHLIDTAVSPGGSQRLQTWLLDTHPHLDQIHQRRQRIQELIPTPCFRDKLHLYATIVTTTSDAGWLGPQLLNWLQQHTTTHSLRPTLQLLTLLTVSNLTLAGLYLAGIIPVGWAILSWSIYGLVTFSRWRQASTLFADASFVADSLRQLGNAFHFLETAPYARRPHLRALCAPFVDSRERPSHQLKRIERIVAAAGLRYNPGLAFLLNFLVPWDLYFAYRLEAYKQTLQTYLPTWLDVWDELEALSALANLAYLNPHYTFPTLLTDAPPQFTAHQIGHPLIPDAERVCNDYHIDQLGTVTIITGSNMAGKSSFLRTLGLNLALAYTGGPVNAHTLHTSLFRLFTSIRIDDSVTDGFSFFYAEVRRLKLLLDQLDETETRPLFFLIDEIFRGTNNRERFVGSQAYIRSLVGRHGVGIIATHDLELVKLAQETAAIRNYHFRDDVYNGRMIFDYKLHPGPCPTTNALKIMQLAGLPVPTEDAG